MRTSATHPLRIDGVSVPGSAGVIGMTLCPGKKQWNPASGDWDRDLHVDLAAVVSFGAAALVTLLAPEEFSELSLSTAQLSAAVAAAGVEWHHLPIRDAGVPDRGFEELWTYAGLRLRRLLRAGRSIVVHCKGGLGRTGAIAARLLVELGAAAADAVEQVRAARPGAIENNAQEQHVAACRAVDSASEDWLNRRVGCLVGGAIGDAFGYPVEFKRLPAIRARYGPRGIREPQLRDGKLVTSDDTQMTLFTLEGLLRGLRGGNPIEEIRLAYLDWLDTQGYGPARHRPVGELVHEAVLRVERDPGTTCVSALQDGGRGSVAKPANQSKGCGGVMRVAPIGLFPERFDEAHAFRLAVDAAALTHGHVNGYLSAGFMASLVHRLVSGADLRPAAESALGTLRQWRGHEQTSEFVRRALGPAPALRDLGEGWVAEEALAIGLYAALNGRTFPDVLALAANHDGDSDSTASIAGQIWGAWKGIDGIPHAWISGLDVLRPLLGLVWKTSALRSLTASRCS
ncbi:MAG: ADP-ribosylglycohydrolase family protein [Bryobacteraceae bacterium]